MNRIHPIAIGIDAEEGVAHLMLGSKSEPVITVPLKDGDTWADVLWNLVYAEDGEDGDKAVKVPR